MSPLSLSSLLTSDLSSRRPSGSEFQVSGGEQQKSANPDHIGGYEVALPILSGIESKFGLCLPKFEFKGAKA
jgi:solute carrier family 25 aspartate/glutamate transporter 12/13